MKIKLEKAYKKATKGPLALGLETNEEDAQLINAEGWHVATVAISPHKETAALLAHAFNALPEVVEALLWLDTDREPSDKGFDEWFAELKMTAKVALARASTVEVLVDSPDINNPALDYAEDGYTPEQV